MFKRLFGKRPAEQAPPTADAEPEIKVSLISIGGAPELDFLFIRPKPIDVVRALEGWTWIGLEGLTVVAVSAFGETFFQTDSQEILYLDTIEGRIVAIAPSLSAFTADLQEVEKRDQLLFGGMVLAARSRGLVLSPEECYDYRIAPILGGQMDVENIEKMSFVVKLHIAGQIHEQVKDLPPGTRINSFKISD
ncbi:MULTISPECIES: T6SS immunity protein Tdi1 domain-containing protein [unclassified Sphingopyxis]|uniref:T6SS immunity protein Tdi1 domain-containing protein n=1 Tax=unclassified Sphingopyxis TaxID=2614943 RepID=UPI00073079A1|nr:MULTISPECIES: T6SS immunity protein Tdi1 domain-containing protein [unclassified Sphingopyxis]KTE23971.1 hypothetical protein ATE61_15675 [Sphingopyxis sp. H057]KTE51124.1 hypothetical protein ATE64_14620 [Sphingopyxis sp. H073]KTE51338.1 hypothetical protein ATE69_16590 [Sphingopyxis sp. H071]KTE59063.1 hypothetical protein ATE66_12780 [Sphingopyxis sp. H107]KTE63316.1 hypothetical protein ATE65_15560 [Sphingopyxis sp. H100]